MADQIVQFKTSDGNTNIYPRMETRTGTLTAINGTVSNESFVKQSGKVVSVHLKMTEIASSVANNTNIASISGVALPPKALRVMGGSATALYNIPIPSLHYVNTNGNISINRSNTGHSCIILDFSYVVD